MDQHAITKYLEQLAVIKQRGQIFQKFSKGAIDDIDEEAAVEIATLQLKVILEILAFGFILTIGEKAIPAYASFANYKNVEEFFSQLRKFDHDYYPQPIIQEKSEQGQMQWSYPDVSKYLTSDDFITLLKHCDLILEPRRIGSMPISIEQCKAANQLYYKKIVQLLNAHLIHIDNYNKAYLFQMGALDAYPTITQFKNVSKEDSKKNKKIPKSSPGTISLTDHLRRQLEYIRRSCELYDIGHLDESIRIAVCIRVLIHDTNNSKSVLRQMDIKERVKLVSSFDLLPKSFQPVSIFPLFASSAKGGTAVPFPLPTPLILRTVSEWWEEKVWMQENTLTRKEIILKTANKEGGAHVEAAPQAILELRKGLSQIMSVKVNGVEVGTPENYHFILIRQFAHELLNSESLTGLI